MLLTSPVGHSATRCSPIHSGTATASLAAATEAGVHTESANRTIHRPDGSTRFEYNSPNGDTAVYTSPPPGFNPLTASDAQLAEYEFPPRPAGEAQQVQWNQAMAAWRQKPDMSTTMVSNTGSGIVASPGVGYDSPTWGGWLLKGSSQYGEVSGTYVEPNAGPGGTCNQAIEAETPWLGMGGWNTNTLAQAGTDAYEPPSMNVAKGEAWWEFYPTNYQQYLNFAANPGNKVYVDVTYTGIAAIDCVNLGTKYGFQAYVEDTTTGASNAAVDCTNTAPDSSTAEWIDERPGINCTTVNNCTTAYLAPFGKTSWSGAQVYDNTLGQTYGIDSLQAVVPGYFIQMNDGKNLTQPGTPGSGNTFTDTYLACG